MKNKRFWLKISPIIILNKDFQQFNVKCVDCFSAGHCCNSHSINRIQIKPLESSWETITSNKKLIFTNYWKCSVLLSGTVFQSKSILSSAPNKKRLKDKIIDKILMTAFQKVKSNPDSLFLAPLHYYI